MNYLISYTQTAVRLNQSGTLLIIAVSLLIVTICFIYLWFYAVKKNRQYHSILKNTKAQLEQYEMELETVKKTVEQLQNEKEELYTQIDDYKLQINEFNLTVEKQHDRVINEMTLTKLLLEDISKLVHKKLPKKRDYIESLNKIDVQYISTLKNLYDENLSVPYIKYCVCFAIGMDIGDVSECFSIEQSSVHMARYRLKKKFGLNNHDDLDVFLRSQVS